MIHRDAVQTFRTEARLLKMSKARYALLRHTGAPDDPSGCHFDLLLEDGDACRTWRLQRIPSLDGTSQPAEPLVPHRLI